MKTRTENDVRRFDEAINACKRIVWLASSNGRYYNMKSEKEHDEAMKQWVKDVNGEMEIFANCYEDEEVMMHFLQELKAA